jgi:hypothetical protein
VEVAAGLRTTHRRLHIRRKREGWERRRWQMRGFESAPLVLNSSWLLRILEE